MRGGEREGMLEESTSRFNDSQVNVRKARPCACVPLFLTKVDNPGRTKVVHSAHHR